MEPVYIPSIEASALYSHMHRDKKEKQLKMKYVGMIPSSLENNMLLRAGLKRYKIKTSNKWLSDDIINVKFKYKVNTGEDVKESLSSKVLEIEAIKDKTEKQIEYLGNLKKFILTIESEISLDKWKDVDCDKLREDFYENGFTIRNVNKKTGEITETKYETYKRSSAKSRIGQCLFIKSHLRDEMISWSRMNLSLKDVQIDFPSLLAYESLVGSSLEDLIHIDPKNILIVSDVESHFKQDCNVIRTGKGDFLDSFKENRVIKNSLFDGESLLDSSYFPEGKSMLLTRNHMYKSASFNCNIQTYLKDNCPDVAKYDNWMIPNMFGQMMYAKDVHLIITPSSLKALKFSKVLGYSPAAEVDMWEYWKQVVHSEESIFGVCKSEKPSKLGLDEKGKTLQQMSYQMVNSLPMSPDEMKLLLEFEHEYLDKLKNDDAFFVEHIRNGISSINSNAMLADLYDHNNDFVRTKMFRDFRKREIYNHTEHIKKGKIRINGDYAVMLGNGLEFLAHSIGQLDTKNPESMSLNYNEVYTTMFDFKKEIVGFRNPHTAPSNVLVAKNTYNKDIKTYFNLSDNIVCVNAIKFPLQDILSSCDYDSDTVLLLDSKPMLTLAKNCFEKYLVCINDVESSKKNYELSYKDMAVIDNQLAMSQRYIGTVVNTGQLLMSTFWDLLSKGASTDELSNLLKKIDVISVLSTICIDLAKKMYSINIKKEISKAERTKELWTEVVDGEKKKKVKNDKPLFWQYVCQDEKKYNYTKYNTPMDYLFEHMTGLADADTKKNLPLVDLLVKYNPIKGDRKQRDKIIDYVDEMNIKLKNLEAEYRNKKMTEDEEKEKNEKYDDIIKYYNFYISKLEVNSNTMNDILLKIAKGKHTKIARKLMNVLHTTQKETFMKAIKQKSPHFVK